MAAIHGRAKELILHWTYIDDMLYFRMWEVEYTDEFGRWWDNLSGAQQEAIARGVELLRRIGPSLGRRHVDSVKNSKFPNMKELRTQHAKRPLRTFFVFDPRRTAILLIGGDKAGDKRFYERMILLADKLYETHLDELRKEGLI